MSSYHFHVPLALFLGGVALETLFPSSLPLIAWLFLILGSLAVIALRETGERKQRLFYILCGCFFLVGMLRTEIASWKFETSPLSSYENQTVLLEGVVIHEPDVRERFQYLDIRVDKEVVRVSADVYEEVSYGDEVKVEGVLETPSTFTTDLGREFHYDTYLKAKGVSYTLQADSVEVISSGNGSQAVTSILKLKQFLLSGIDMSFNQPEAGLGAGILLGVKQALGDDVERAFRMSGIIHIVVLSGYNIMLIVSFVMMVLSLFMKRRARTIVGLLSIVAFAIMVGLSATVVRASIMASLLLVAGALGRTYDVSRALLFAGCVMVFFNPYLLLYDIGFQLSFMATLGLILFLPHFEAHLVSGKGISFQEFFFSTLATQIAVLPLLLYYMGEVSIVSLIVNVLVLPVVPFAMLCTFAAGMLVHLSAILATPFILLAHYALAYIIAVAVWFAGLPFATVRVPAFSPYVVPLLYAVMGFVYWRFTQKKEKKKDARVMRASSSDTPVLFR